MSHQSLIALEALLVHHGVDLDDLAFELALNSHGWRVAREHRDTTGVHPEIECLVECDESIPRSLKVVSDEGYHARDVALMRALARVLELGVTQKQS
jgi:hypothetical protein